MPELPEVETIARNLRTGNISESPDRESLIGAQITAAEVLWPRTLAAPETAEFLQRIIGQRIRRIGRRGKYLMMHLDRDVLLIHLRMSGDIRVVSRAEPAANHDRLVLELDGRRRLAFNDTRKFGRAWLVVDPEEILAGLGPEPFDEHLSPDRFISLLQKRRRQIKPLLLDQSFLAGLGNIYTDEALFRARIHPRQLASTLSEQQGARLLQAIRDVLRAGIQSDGSSIDWVYRGGGFQDQFQVYGRAGEPCPRCHTEIERELIGQRGTHFCPKCQPRPE